MKLASTKILAFIAVIAVALGFFVGCGTCKKACEKADVGVCEPADTVVYGKIYTSKVTGDYAEAFAVKDGKYVYVGDEAGAKKYVKEGYTKVIDRRGKGLVTAGATEGHGHYVVAATVAYKNFMMTATSAEEIVAYMKKQIEENPNAKMYFAYGWTNSALLPVKETIDMRAALDNLCKDKVIIMMDNTGHNCFMNSKAIEVAGLTPETTIKGGFLSKDANGRLLGLASDIATNYVVAAVFSKEELLSVDDFSHAVRLAEDQLHSYGYTSYLDATTTYFGNAVYKGVSEYDKTTGLTINMGACYKIDPFNDAEKALDDAAAFKAKYTTKHFMPNGIKLFADGECVETMSGWVLTPYKDGTTGTQVWATDVFDKIVKGANQRGLSVHVHASGDAAVQQAVEAFIKAEASAKGDIRNCVGHTRNVTERVKDLMAKHHIFSATNICWRMMIGAEEEHVNKNFDRDFFLAGYPMKSLLDRGIVMTSSTDFPANSGGPCDMPSIIEMAVNGTLPEDAFPGEKKTSYDKRECITVEQALDVFTINGAKQMGLAHERGSIEVGKYADFIFLPKDITTIPKDQIHTAQVETAYFEGKEVYRREALQ